MFFRFLKLHEWYEVPQSITKVNNDKSHFTPNMEAVFVSSIKRDIIFNSKLEKRLGTTIDYQLDFDEHISRHCDSLFFVNQEQRREIVKLFQVYNFVITL